MLRKSSLKEVKDFLLKNKPLLQDKFGVRKTGLFGSIVKGRERESSDIDVLIEFKEGSETFKNYMGLKFYLEDNLGRKVDLVIKETLKPTIKQDVIREAVYV